MRTSAIAACLLSLVILSGCGERATVQGAGGRKLTLIGPGSVTVKQGDIAAFKVRIERGNLESPVTITFANLPAGVHAVDDGVNIIGLEGTFHLQADSSADQVANHQALLTAAATPDGIAASVAFTVNVTPKE